MGVGLNLFGRRKNGKEFPVEVRLSYMQKNQDTLAVAFVTDISEHKQAEAALRESHDKLLDLSGKLMSAQDEESKRISRELHDAFSQELAALSTESRLLKRELPPEARGAAKKIEGVALRIGKLATDIHQMSRRLHPAILDDLGLSGRSTSGVQRVFAIARNSHGFQFEQSSQISPRKRRIMPLPCCTREPSEYR